MSVITIKLPSLLDKNAFESLTRTQKRDYIHRVLQKIFDLNRDRPEGISFSELISILPFGNATMRQTLRDMLSVRQIYAIKSHKGRILSYHANGQICHSFKRSTIRLGSANYKAILILNDQRLQVFLQEKRVDRYGGERYAGGLIIDARDFKEFAQRLAKMVPQIELEGENVRNQIVEMIQ